MTGKDSRGPARMRGRWRRAALGTVLAGALCACTQADQETETPAGDARWTPPSAAQSRPTPGDNAPPPRMPEALPQGPWTTLADRLVGAATLAEANEATREILARGGIATTGADGVLVATIGPASPYRALAHETVLLASQVRDRDAGAGSLTVAEFAQMLHGVGWPTGSSVGWQSSPADWHADSGREFLAYIEDADRHHASGPRQDDAAQAQADREETSRGRETRIALRREALQPRIDALILAADAAREDHHAARQDLGNATGRGPPELVRELRARADEKARASSEASLMLRNARIEMREVERVVGAEIAREDRERRHLEAVARKIGPNYRAGRHLLDFLDAWVREALEDPQDPRNFTPLFLAEMARRQDPPVDLLGSGLPRLGRANGAIPLAPRGAPSSERMRLTLLEMQLFAAAFHRREAAPPAPASVAGTTAANLAYTTLDWLLPPAHAQSTPCSDVKDRVAEAFGKDVAEVAHQGARELAAAPLSRPREIFGRALGQAVEDAFGSEGAGKAAKTLGSTDVLLKLVKLATFFSNVRLRVEAAPASAHLPPEGSYAATFVASAGVDPEALAEALEDAGTDRGLRDCLRTLELPSLDDVRDLARESEQWLVEWLLVEGSPEYATIPLAHNRFAYPGRLAMRLTRTSDAESSARLVVEMAPESGAGKGTLRRGHITARARLDAASAPGLGVVANALKGLGGLADNVAELGAGWVQAMAKPSAFATMEVEFHVSDEVRDDECHFVRKDGVGSC